jgi:pimeloyl-ACP methyl ester carboxylesterase
MAEDVESFITTHSISRPTLLGHSMGAKVAMTLALRQPSKYSALVPVDNAPLDAALKSDFGAYVTAMKKIADRRPPVTRQSEAEAILAEYEKELPIRQFLLTNLVKGPVAAQEGDSQTKPQTAMVWRIPLQTLAKALPDMADFPFKDPDSVRFEGPTLVVRGTKSHYVSDECLPLVGKFFPRFELLDIEAGHWVMSEKFEEFRAGLVEWMKRVVDQE